MLKRKNWLVLCLMIMFVFFSQKNVYAGTCTCLPGSDGNGYISKNNCDSDTEYYKCNGGKGGGINGADTSVGCSCIKKEDSNLKENSCTCNGSGVITANNCQDSKPYCNTRENAVCICTGDGTLDTTGKKTSELTDKSYDPFGSCGSSSIDTALGCIPTEMNNFVPWLMTWLFGVAGGIAFLLMSYGFILIATSSGDEKKIQGAKETITSAIVGLLVCIFAVFILRLIAINILKIPGF